MSVLGTLGKKLQGALNSLSAVSPIDEVVRLDLLHFLFLEYALILD